MFQNENGNLQEAATATAGRDLTAKANLPAQGAVAVIFEADVHATEAKTGHEIKSSEHGPSGKRSRLNWIRWVYFLKIGALLSKLIPVLGLFAIGHLAWVSNISEV
jgi:hypothetical protein